MLEHMVRGSTYRRKNLLRWTFSTNR